MYLYVNNMLNYHKALGQVNGKTDMIRQPNALSTRDN